jgi:hypothetical protein
MSTFRNSLPPAGIGQLTLVRSTFPSEVKCVSAPEDDGLGCVRGFMVAMLCNVIVALIIVAVWSLWRFLR